MMTLGLNRAFALTFDDMSAGPSLGSCKALSGQVSQTNQHGYQISGLLAWLQDKEYHQRDQGQSIL